MEFGFISWRTRMLAHQSVLLTKQCSNRSSSLDVARETHCCWLAAAMSWAVTAMRRGLLLAKHLPRPGPLLHMHCCFSV